MIKNKAGQKFRFYVGTGGLAGSITAKISKDYGAFAATNDVHPAEISGVSELYEFDLTQAETNANNIYIQWTDGGFRIGGEHINTTPDIDLQNKAIKMAVNKAEYDRSTGELTVYDDDGETVLFTQAITVAGDIETRTRTDA
jgi:hypothetical protein